MTTTINTSIVVSTLVAFLWTARAQQYGHQYQQPHQHVPNAVDAQQQFAAGQQPYGQPAAQQQPPVQQFQQYQQSGGNVLHDSARIHDKQHIKEHLQGVVTDPDLSRMSEEELQFHYFKMHDNDNNNKLDGSELIKSLIHWHVEESRHMGANAPPTGTTKVFTDKELETMIDPIFQMDDKNTDGFIDYPEFVAAQKARGF